MDKKAFREYQKQLSTCNNDWNNCNRPKIAHLIEFKCLNCMDKAKVGG